MSFFKDLGLGGKTIDFQVIYNDGGKSGYLIFEPAGITFRPSVSFSQNSIITIPANTIKSVDVLDLSRTTSRPTVTRMVFFKWWAFAMPKTEHEKAARIDVTTKDGKFYSFTTKGASDADVRTKTSEIIHQYLNANPS
ncbi:hypothetical protein FWF89_00385 [Candidatus Saccharibacteria bacterium]|nr:hypothetical protein [Candidatus Saccharibacteria bacterium]